MTRPRSAQVSLDDTLYYHCIARCVRRAFLCGEDTYSGQNFDHRRDWLVERIKWQARLFAIDICAYAIMSNHYHLVVRVDREGASAWSDQEVIERWCKVFRGPLLIQSYLAGEELGRVERETVSDIVAVWRERLTNISWFMRCLNEFIARQANREDHWQRPILGGALQVPGLAGHAGAIELYGVCGPQSDSCRYRHGSPRF